MHDRFQSPAEVAEARGIDVHIVLAAIRAGELDATNWARPGSRRPRWRISPQALQQFEQRRAAKAPPPRQRRQRKPQNVISFV
jgi:hypothetical protein